jgi:hypothetical protein
MKAVWLGYALGVLLCTAFAVVGAVHVWPPMDGDSPAYFGTAVEVARGNSFENYAWPGLLEFEFDGPGGRRYVYHGFLYPLLVGELAWLSGGDVPAAVAWGYAIVLLSALASGAAMLICWASKDQTRANLQFVVGLLAVVSSFALSFAWFGRMDAMVILLIALGVLAWRCLSRTWAYFTLGIILPAVLLTSPASGALAVLAFGLAVVYRENTIRWRPFAACLSGAFLCVVLGVLAYPYPIGDWFEGVSRQSKVILTGIAPYQGFVSTWLTRGHLPLLLVSFLLLAGGAALAVVRWIRSSTFWRQLLTTGLMLLFALAIYRVAFVKSEAAYNAIVWMPLFAAVWLTSLERRFQLLLLIIALALPMVGLFRSSLLLVSQISTGPSFAEVRGVISRRVNEGVLVSKGLFLAVPDLRRVQIGKPGETDASQPVWFIDQQMATGRTKPRQYAGYDMVLDEFRPSVRVFGLPISRAPTGWQYSLYRKCDE